MSRSGWSGLSPSFSASRIDGDAKPAVCCYSLLTFSKFVRIFYVNDANK